MRAVNRASYDATYAAPSFLPLPLSLSPSHPRLIVAAPATVSAAAAAATSLTLRIGKRDLMRFAFILKY